MEINDVLIFDTETTGDPERTAQWDLDYKDYPHIVQLAWMFGDKEETHIIFPDGWEIPDDAVAVHGITTEYAKEHGEPFEYVVDMFIQDCRAAAMICGHNIHFDTSVIKANILREFGWDYYDGNGVESALFKGKRIDTMRPSMKWVDARMANGRLKFPRLEELYARCFPGETFPAHDALADVKACARCLPVLVEMGLVELKIKEYPDAKLPMMGEEKANAPETAKNGPNSGAKVSDDKLPIQREKTPQIEDLAKISDAAAELLEQNNF